MYLQPTHQQAVKSNSNLLTKYPKPKSRPRLSAPTAHPNSLHAGQHSRRAPALAQRRRQSVRVGLPAAATAAAGLSAQRLRGRWLRCDRLRYAKAAGRGPFRGAAESVRVHIFTPATIHNDPLNARSTASSTCTVASASASGGCGAKSNGTICAPPASR